MDELKRKQFHITEEDNKILKELSGERDVSEAEIVREAVREYAYRHLKTQNPLLDMAHEAEKNETTAESDLSVHHDQYLKELYKK